MRRGGGFDGTGEGSTTTGLHLDRPSGLSDSRCCLTAVLPGFEKGQKAADVQGVTFLKDEALEADDLVGAFVVFSPATVLD